MPQRSCSGISLLEVLFAMLLVTVGLFGAIALLPVAAQQAKRGRNADMQAVAGESAVAEFFLRDMNRTNTWIAPVNAAYFKSKVPIQRTDPVTKLPMVDPITGAPVYRYVLADYFPLVGYCIDPLFVDANRPDSASLPNPIEARYFPYYRPEQAGTVSADSDPDSSVRMERITLTRTPNEPWQLALPSNSNKTPGAHMADDDNDGTADNANETGWPGSDDFKFAMSNAHAQSVFYSEDDLFFDRVKDATIPASQVYSRLDNGSGTMVNMRRLAEGNFSWFATLAPRNIINPDPTTNDDYILSIIVMYRRPYTSAGLVMDSVSTSLVPCAERVTEVFWAGGSTGIGGGEIILRARSGREIGDLETRPGDWIMLSGSYPSTYAYDANWINPGPAPPVQANKRPVYQWYRVIDSDADVETRTSGSNTYYERRVSIAGPDWPANLIMTEAQYGSKKSVTQATLVTGVVSVYEKSVRLNFK
jgi:hypothetical protein